MQRERSGRWPSPLSCGQCPEPPLHFSLRPLVRMHRIPVGLMLADAVTAAPVDLASADGKTDSYHTMKMPLVGLRLGRPGGTGEEDP
ncbi:MAG: hypothetical protein ACK55I_46955 [bacterium]